MARKRVTPTRDLTQDAGQTAALNEAYAEFEQDKDRTKALVRSGLVGRGIAIRNMRLREAQFSRIGGKKR